MKTLCFLFLFYSFSSWAQAPKADLMAEPWLVYEVSEAHSLWHFAENLGIPKKNINIFLDTMLKDNPRLKKPDLIYPGEKIIVRSSVIETFVSKSKVFKTYWSQKKEIKRELASKLSLSLDSKLKNSLFVQPKIGYTRVDSKQRSTGAKASLISSAFFGVNTHYNWKNTLGTSGLGLELEWVKYDGNLGTSIKRNQLLSFDLYWRQFLELSKSWEISAEIGYYQSPYLFTDQNDQLFLKQASQPGAGVGITKTLSSIRSQLNLRVKYFYFGYAGDTLIEDGVGFYFSGDHRFKMWSLPLQASLWTNYDQQLSEVTQQSRLGIGLGLGFTW